MLDMKHVLEINIFLLKKKIKYVFNFVIYKNSLMIFLKNNFII